jgi:Ca-activated chloride channel homolog
MTFEMPWAFLLLLLLPAVYFLARRRRPTAVLYSDTRRLMVFARGRARWLWLPSALWLVAAVCLVTALARPQERNVQREIIAPGIDIMLVFDMSTSMLATDFPPNRFEGAREVLKRFVTSRTTDRIGLVIFAGRAYTQVPLTFDYRVVQQMLDSLVLGQIEDGTAIGMGIAEAVNRLRASDAKSKVIVMLTDGINNRGRIDPATAGELARLKGIRIYTIGMGSEIAGTQGRLGQALGVNPDVAMNAALLDKIARDTGGRYFEAAAMRDLAQVYETIGALEKSDVKMSEFVTVKERYADFLAMGFFLFLLGWMMDATLFRRFP